MRYSFALLAAVAAAAPQASVNPISQIGDGQIQAPTAPASVPYSAPAISAPAVPSVPAVSAPAVPSVPAVSVPAGMFSLKSSSASNHVLISSQVTPVPLPSPVKPSAPIVSVPGGNATTPAGTGAASKTPSAPTGASSSGLPQATGAAGSTLVSFGGVVLAAVGAAVFA